MRCSKIDGWNKVGVVFLVLLMSRFAGATSQNWDGGAGNGA